MRQASAKEMIRREKGKRLCKRSLDGEKAGCASVQKGGSLPFVLFFQSFR